jgi:hypothetical protein
MTWPIRISIKDPAPPAARRTTPNTEAGEKNTPASSTGTSRYAQKATEAASTLTSQVQGVLDEQVVKGARMMTNVANSVRRAAEELDSDAPQIAGLVRGAADRLEEYSHTLEDQSVSDIYLGCPLNSLVVSLQLCLASPR